MRAIAYISLMGTCVLGLAACTVMQGALQEEYGQAQAAIEKVPEGVRCITLEVNGAFSVNHKFDVTPGLRSVLDIGGLPLGDVAFSARAFDASCTSAESSGLLPSYSGPSARVRLERGKVASVVLHLSRTGEGQAEVCIDFDDGTHGSSRCGHTASTPDAGTPPAPDGGPSKPPPPDAGCIVVPEPDAGGTGQPKPEPDAGRDSGPAKPDSGSASGACGSLAEEQRVECCAEEHAAGYEFLFRQYQACTCAPSECRTVCATSLCADNFDAIEDACMACMQETACNESQAMYDACWNDASCRAFAQCAMP